MLEIIWRPGRVKNPTAQSRARRTGGGGTSRRCVSCVEVRAAVKELVQSPANFRASLNYKVKATFFEVLCTSPNKKVQHPLPDVVKSILAAHARRNKGKTLKNSCNQDEQVICKREASERAQQDGSSPLRSMATKTGAAVVAMEERNRWRRGGQGGRFGGYD
ncbi:uncharacterized protein LOC119357997 [Triticum dicoccoides]|uniref:uncharacterized protein LOC119357997 n=1 Tax=Triticum dicoccoides TaxID=85692 RepID=UPI00188F83E7|nr:uncharacterized protein LOC119357997 [Triticum dicoccoides]